MLLTILTPTFNRKKMLKDLYNSLKNQTSKEFVWLIVDDGSTDNTKKMVEQLRENSDFPIQYIYKKNGGKHTALNVGIAKITSELTFIVDSDDTLTVDAVETILNYWELYKENKELCGFSFLRAFPNGKVNGKKFIEDRLIDSYINTRINANDTHSDKAEVIVTRCLKEFPFPEYQEEKFLGEDIVWMRMARKYKMLHSNKVIYIGSYMSGGLTDTRRKHNISSPIGCMHRAEEFLKPDIRLRYRIKGGLQYIIYGKFSGQGIYELLRQTEYKLITILCAFPGLIVYWNWKKTRGR